MSQNQEIKTVTITLSVTVQVNGTDTKQLLADAEKKVVESLQSKFPSGYRYSVTEGAILETEKAVGGKIVFIPDIKTDGVIFGKTAANLSVTTRQGKFHCKASGLQDSKATFEEVFVSRPEFMKPEWGEGCMGYLKVKDEYLPIVVGKKKAGKTPVYTINDGGSFYSLTDSQLTKLLDTIPEK
ncbi:hypothetical protein [Paenibacillus periandrae]|uniref:hypothetical protein n=1 Tax=Paenibacillus periandrae TaxID=1761741 RepID=UPI001F08DBEB|nr:hypothetical protein [Paenibacillus periandrae]